MSPTRTPIDDAVLSACPVLSSSIIYLGKMDVFPVFYAEQYERNNLVLEPTTVEIRDARELPEKP